jgi:hypothetical protein
MGINLGSVTKFIGKAAGGALGGVGGALVGGAVDKIAGQVFGKKNRPSEILSGGTTPPQNPYQVQLVDSARNLGKQGTDLTALVTPELRSAILGQVNGLKDTSDIDRMTSMILGSGTTNQVAGDMAAKANLEAGLARRGVGGGIAEGARAVQAGAAMAGRGAVRAGAEKYRIGETQSRQARLTQLLQQLQDAGQADTLRADQILQGLGQNEQYRIATGQANKGNIAQQIAQIIAQSSASKSGGAVARPGSRPASLTTYRPDFSGMETIPTEGGLTIQRPVRPTSLATSLWDE